MAFINEDYPTTELETRGIVIFIRVTYVRHTLLIEQGISLNLVYKENRTVKNGVTGSR